MRLDNLFLKNNAGVALVGGEGGQTTFSFDHPQAHMTIEIIDDTNNGLADRIRIFGDAYGGRDIGSTYGVGEGRYHIDMTYLANVSTVVGPNGGWRAAQSPGNIGTISAITGQFAGETWAFADKNDAGFSFHLLNDGHRLGAYPAIAATNPHVGRGWAMLSNGVVDGNQDFLFIAVPAPSSGAALGLALVGLSGARRRRSA